MYFQLSLLPLFQLINFNNLIFRFTYFISTHTYVKFNQTLMSDPALVPFQFDSDTEHPLGQHLDHLSYDGTIPDEDIYDAINDETFGVETSLISAEDSDLADFAIRVILK